MPTGHREAARFGVPFASELCYLQLTEDIFVEGEERAHRDRGKQKFFAHAKCNVDVGEKGGFSFLLFDTVDRWRVEIANFKCAPTGILALFSTSTFYYKRRK